MLATIEKQHSEKKLAEQHSGKIGQTWEKDKLHAETVAANDRPHSDQLAA